MGLLLGPWHSPCPLFVWELGNRKENGSLKRIDFNVHKKIWPTNKVSQKIVKFILFYKI
jgi:hypothetical protein